MRHIPLTLLNGLMTRSGFKPTFLRVDFFCEVRLGLVACGRELGIRFWVCSSNSVRLWSLVQGVSKWRVCSL